MKKEGVEERKKFNKIYGQLAQLTEAGECGELVVLKAPQIKAGSIFLHQGRIVWALSKNQKVNLGEFLLRKGTINRQTLNRVAEIYKQAKGKRKFGELLVELGYLDRETLTKYLFLHTRFAVLDLLLGDYPYYMFQRKIIASEKDLSFSLEELLEEEIKAQLKQTNTASRSLEQQKSKERKIFSLLRNISGYIFAGIYTQEGELIDSDSLSKFNVEPVKVGASLLFSLSALEKSFILCGLESPKVIQFYCGELVLFVGFNQKQKICLVCLFKISGNLGLAKLTIKTFIAED